MARGMRASLVATSALLGAMLVAPSPAGAAFHVLYEFEPSPGMPATSEPARTIDEATASLTLSATDDVSASVRLGAEPNAVTDADLVLALGTLDGDGGRCLVGWSETFSTFEPGDGATREGDAIEISRELDGQETWDCAKASLTEPDQPGAVLDHHDGTVTSTVISDPAGWAKIERVGHRRLPVGRWSYVRVKIHNRMSEATGLRVIGHSHGPLKARRVVIDRTIESGERLVVRLPVKLRRDKAAKLRVTTRPSGAFMARADVQRVRVRPVR